MIPINLEDPIILKRTLEELESKIPETLVEIEKLNPIDLASDLATSVKQINLISNRVNIIAAILNKTLR